VNDYSFIGVGQPWRITSLKSEVLVVLKIIVAPQTTGSPIYIFNLDQLSDSQIVRTKYGIYRIISIGASADPLLRTNIMSLRHH
jgi:hypothetical protein